MVVVTQRIWQHVSRCALPFLVFLIMEAMQIYSFMQNLKTVNTNEGPT